MLEVRTAGDPDEPETLFTDLSPQTMADMVTCMGTPVSAPTVREWLASLGMGYRKIEKSLAGGVSPDRDAQFCRIKELLEEHRLANNPVFSIDTKAKEHLGQLYREGRVRTESPFLAFDHDFPSWATGVVIPHGIYDCFNNRGHLNIGLDHDTGAFACDSFRWYWRNIGKWAWPGATSILWLCDCGGSNSASQYLFKEDLQRLANDLKLTIRVAHYPSYCSKYNPMRYNPIERRFFPHVGRACQGLLFDTGNRRPPDEKSLDPHRPHDNRQCPERTLRNRTQGGARLQAEHPLGVRHLAPQVELRRNPTIAIVISAPVLNSVCRRQIRCIHHT